MNRTLLRAARQIHERYQVLHHEKALPELPVTHWNLLRQTWRQRELCRDLHLTATEQVCTQRYLRQLDRLGTRCRDLAAVQWAEASQTPPTFRMLYEELQGLHGEFEQVCIDLREQTLTVTTEPIVLEGIDLGPFEIRFFWSSLRNSSPYEVVALEPNPAAENSDTTHPHVQSDTLCEGEARLAIGNAMAQGRLCDLFLLITSVLNTYNPQSAYCTLSEWEGVSCGDCGGMVCAEEIGSCCRCQGSRCPDCMCSCEDCCESICQGCVQTCQGCDDPYCEHCLSNCESCSDSFCRSCLDEGLCAACQDHLSESDDETDSQSQTVPPPTASPASSEAIPQAGPEVQPDCLGEAAVPA